MKTITIIISLLFTAFITGLLTYQKPQSTEISVLGDITDSFISKPDADEIANLYNFEGDNKWNAAQFRFSDITDISLNKVSELKIESANKWLSNEIERDKEIKKFKEKLSVIVSSKDNVGKNHSSVYLPLSRELNRLSESKFQKRIVIIYSDLMENNPDVSLYNKEEFKLLKSNPDSLKKLFESWQPLPSLNGIAVFLIYQPKDIDADREFKEVSAFYKKLLEERGATVTVSANLSI